MGRRFESAGRLRGRLFLQPAILISPEPKAMESATCYLYILQSQSSGRLYIGQTANLDKRLEEHNQGVTPSTRNRGPWKLIFHLELPNRHDAMVLEHKLKKWKNKKKVLRWIERQKNELDE